MVLGWLCLLFQLGGSCCCTFRCLLGGAGAPSRQEGLVDVGLHDGGGVGWPSERASGPAALLIEEAALDLGTARVCCRCHWAALPGGCGLLVGFQSARGWLLMDGGR